MTSVQESIEVAVPVTAAYNQWVKFEEFPQFMEGVKSVRQLGERRYHWVVEVAGKTKEWDAEITDMQVNKAISWAATDGTPNSGKVYFEPLSPDRTAVTVDMGFAAEGILEKAGAALGLAERRVEADLKRFQALVEAQWSAAVDPLATPDDRI